MSSLKQDNINELKEIFDLVDTDGSGSINREELSDLMATLGIQSTDADIDSLIAEMDSDGNGDISFDEFLAVMTKKVDVSYDESQIKLAFKVFQGNCPTGYVDPKKLIEAMTIYGSEKLTIDQATSLVRQLQTENNGLINYDSFVSLMMKD